MDTSDSEYFESADEDIQSDEETFKNQNKNIAVSLVQDVKSKDLSCLPSIEISDHGDISCKIEKIKQENTDKTFKENDPIQGEKSENIGQITSKVEDIKILTEDKIKPSDSNKSSEAVKDSKKEESSHGTKQDNSESGLKKGKSNTKSKLGSKISKDSVRFEATPEKKAPNIIKRQEVEVETLEKNKEFVAVQDKQPDVQDENLWDDDELDWDTEGKLENEAKPNNVQWNVQNKRVGESITTKTSSQKFTSDIGERPQNQSDSWGAWGSWGVSVLSTATQSVSSITSQLTNVIETGLGAVDPEELAKIDREEKRKIKEILGDNLKEENCPSEVTPGGFGLGNLVKLVENTGTKMISGGLDTLETIGKKTMEVLQEGDPGLKKKRAFLKIDQDKPVLSQILREAKERAEIENQIYKKSCMKKTKNYETLFDDHQGLVHLEALELLSKQCEIKLKNIQNSTVDSQNTEFAETMEQIKELCELPDEEDDEQISVAEIRQRLDNAVSEMNVPISYEKLVNNWEETEVWISALNLNVCDEKELHQQAIETLAQVTSMAMEQFHKTGELLLVKDRRSTADEADSLVQITTTLTSLIGIVAAKFSEKLNSKISDSTNNEVSELITNVFFEAANSSSYIQDALQLLIPVLQVGAV